MPDIIAYDFSEGFSVTDDVKRNFDNNGYILVRNLLTPEEHGLLKKNADHSEGIFKHEYKVQAENDRSVTLTLWNHPGNDITGYIARSQKVATTCEKLLDCEVFHFHGKGIKKVPSTGGNFVWHQDYGYWYKQGFLFPDMMTVFVAVDETTIENGCLQILSGSHKCGRLDHGFVGGEQGVETTRVEEIKKRCPELYIPMKPGDALFFHSNILHCSGHNRSQSRRIAYAIAYCSSQNDSVKEHPFAYYNPLKKIKDDDIRKCSDIFDLSGKEFLDPAKDHYVKQAK